MAHMPQKGSSPCSVPTSLDETGSQAKGNTCPQSYQVSSRARNTTWISLLPGPSTYASLLFLERREHMQTFCSVPAEIRAMTEVFIAKLWTIPCQNWTDFIKWNQKKIIPFHSDCQQKRVWAVTLFISLCSRFSLCFSNQSSNLLNANCTQWRRKWLQARCFPDACLWTLNWTPRYENKHVKLEEMSLLPWRKQSDTASQPKAHV